MSSKVKAFAIGVGSILSIAPIGVNIPSKPIRMPTLGETSLMTRQHLVRVGQNMRIAVNEISREA